MTAREVATEAVLTRDEARAMDASAALRGLPGLLLMENAGRGASDVLLAAAPSLDDVVCVGGVGQNGGDAWVVARHLMLAGVRPTCLLVDSAGRSPSGDAAVMANALASMGCAIERLADDALAARIARASVLVDGVFGTGLVRDVAGQEACAIGAMRRARWVASLDLPSGVDADTGRVLGVAPVAALTLTFGALKRGLITGEGRALAGDVRVISIGAPPPSQPACARLTSRGVSASLPRRAAGTHKGSAGRVLVFAGTTGTTGAALLAARAAHRMGAGLVTLAVPASHRAIFDARVLETMTVAYEHADDALAFTGRVDAVVLGPGFGVDDDSAAIVDRIVRRAACPVVLDADALTVLADDAAALHGAVGLRIVTPHPAEAARMLRCDVSTVEADRFAAVDALARDCGGVAVLKGPGTLIASAVGSRFVCATGGAELAVAGSGDVLAGAIAGTLAGFRGTTGEEVARLVACVTHLHGLAGTLASDGNDRGLLAGEIADALPHALRAVRTP